MQKEIEVKFVLGDKEKATLQEFLDSTGITPHKVETQDNFYYKAQDNLDLRIRRTDSEAFLILKKGWMHDENREEIEVRVAREDFEKLDTILTNLGYEYDTKWHRERTEYRYEAFTIVVDFNAGYGWVAEIEKVVGEGEEDAAKKDILDLAEKIGLEPTPPEVFDNMYKYYKENWQHYYDSGETFTLDEIG